MGPDSLKDAFDQAWKRHTQGGHSPPLSWKDQVRFRRLEAGTRMTFESDNKAEYTGSYKYQRDGKWIYKRALPGAEFGLKICWTKFSSRGYVGRTVSGNQATDHFAGTQSIWYKMTWDRHQGRWFWLSQAERETFRKDFKKQALARIARASKTNIPEPRKGYQSLDEIMRAYSREFEVRAYQAFIKELDAISWPDP
jgi:hypothetical protein